ncbi:MFS transporter [Halopseudomonas aestusnigri]|uniref:Predicted arabinose efflux permease, MFS family n=1 Tax=Halopseudomonas aestusnigri TaxID=857252 RepID=A0AAQ1JRF3_9GAMM|nr:MFS transporter [Halopseudomonas aestusnigri]OWL84680.1 MFS transporter [Halopseudomonas aestusnigri]SEG67965.1 Predicted arabinose efflux permease, MFS family [Halopseudomonas aestusnigri]
MHQVDSMSPQERRASISLALVFAFRMLGLFMVLPVLATYGQQLQGATPLLIGMAIGAYGLTQAVLQIPFGMLSDRIGRKPVIVFGLVLFAAGGLLAAGADSIQQVIAGRILQGAGAIAAAVMALVADSTREQHRTKAMAMIGMSIGLAFAVAMVAGPVVAGIAGLGGVFLSTSMLAIVGIGLVLLVVPTPQLVLHHRDAGIVRGALRPALANPELLRLNYGIACLHAILMATFLAIPLALQQQAGLPKEEHWWVYLAALLLSFFGMVPFIIYAERQRQMKRVLLGAVALLVLVQPLFWLTQASLPWLVACIILFFVGFNLLEATLPSLLSKIAPAGGKGTAMGVYSTSQFAGAALGGMFGGWLFAHFGLGGVFVGCALLALSWLAIGVTMREPPYVTSYRLAVSSDRIRDAGLAASLLAVAGVTDVVIVADESAAYLKVDSKLLDREALDRVAAPV